MKEDVALPKGTLVVVNNPKLKTHGSVFEVTSNFLYANRYGWTVEVTNGKLSFTIKKANLELYEEAPQVQYRVANTANNILKESFDTIEAAEAAIRKWAGGLNQQIEFQILTVVKSYKANREIVLEELK